MRDGLRALERTIDRYSWRLPEGGMPGAPTAPDPESETYEADLATYNATVATREAIRDDFLAWLNGEQPCSIPAEFRGDKRPSWCHPVVWSALWETYKHDHASLPWLLPLTEADMQDFVTGVLDHTISN
jgi:hypothetical protein